MPALHARTLSPKELADVIGVSPSSVKRWIDAGEIDVVRTVGGHRRIPLPEALRFIREQHMPLLRPDLLGLTDLSALPLEARSRELSAALLAELLHSGETDTARGIVIAAYLDGWSLPDLFDGPIAGALHEIGILWQHDARGIFIEHQATTACVEVVNQLRVLLPPPPSGAPVAVGGAPAGDVYLLPSAMAAAVLASTGFEVVNLGADTPAAAFRHAVEAHAPQLLWLSATTTGALEQEHPRLVSVLLPLLERSNVTVAAGGRAAVALRDRWPPAVRILESMAALSHLAAQVTARS